LLAPGWLRADRGLCNSGQHSGNSRAISASCTGSAEFQRYSSADAAVEAGQIALQVEDFERAADAFGQARGLAPNPSHAAQFALDQCLALIGCKAEGDALALLIDLADQHGASLRPESLGDLARKCAQSGRLCSTRLAELCLQIAHDEFDADELARIDPESIARAIRELSTVESDILAQLGYVDTDRNQPVPKPDSLPTMQE
jgi:hypothetical protein